MSYKESFEYRMGWLDCYVASLRSISESFDAGHDVSASAVFRLMDDVREVQE